MKFARVVFVAAGIWGFLVLTPMFFLLGTIGRMRASPITSPEFFYGFLAVAMAWQCAFFVIGGDPVRLRAMMIPAVVEKFGYVMTMAILLVEHRVAAIDAVVAAPDAFLGILFVVAFAKTRESQRTASSTVSGRTVIRVARPSDELAAVVKFYTDGVGLTQLDAFENHQGFDGVMVGTPGAAYHLEFTRPREHGAGAAPTLEYLLVFYLPDPHGWQLAIDRMIAAGYQPVPSSNPYWDRAGRTFEDPDGFRVVLQNGTWCA